MRHTPVSAASVNAACCERRYCQGRRPTFGTATGCRCIVTEYTSAKPAHLGLGFGDAHGSATRLRRRHLNSLQWRRRRLWQRCRWRCNVHRLAAPRIPQPELRDEAGQVRVHLASATLGCHSGLRRVLREHDSVNPLSCISAAVPQRQRSRNCQEARSLAALNTEATAVTGAPAGGPGPESGLGGTRGSRTWPPRRRRSHPPPPPPHTAASPPSPPPLQSRSGSTVRPFIVSGQA